MAVDYSDLAATYDRTRSRESELREFWLPSVLRLGGITEGAHVLDVGCGTGRLAVPLSVGHEVVGLDASREMLAVARAKRSRAAFVLGDAGRLPFAAKTFDAAVAVMVLHLLGDFRGCVREMARVARRATIATIDIPARRKHAIDEAFPSLQAIDERRFPKVPAIEEECRDAGWGRVERHDVGRRVESSVKEFIERVRGRYVSTLTLLPSGEFERGLAWLEAELPRRGDRYAYDHTVTFVNASA
jgi:SAM-dependent methyltransferase